MGTPTQQLPPRKVTFSPFFHFCKNQNTNFCAHLFTAEIYSISCVYISIWFFIIELLFLRFRILRIRILVFTDVLKKGDCYYNSGDLLYVSEDGFYYWSDRVGDTFRWKGENVATTEITEVLDVFPGFADVAVYGVSVPDCDGRVGMACIVLSQGTTIATVDWAAYHKEICKHLPAYSRPSFLRITKAIPQTTTFKHQKAELVKDGFDVNIITSKGDSIFYYSSKDGSVVPLTQAIAQQINTGVIKL